MDEIEKYERFLQIERIMEKLEVVWYDNLEIPLDDLYIDIFWSRSSWTDDEVEKMLDRRIKEIYKRDTGDN